MKVIDLLNKIANGEIEANTELFYKKEKYRHIDNLFENYYVEEVLNDEVEIIEEDKKIEKYDTGLTNGRFTKDSIKSAMEGENMSLEEIVIEIAKEQTTLKEKVFEIIDKLNEMEKE